METEAYFPLDEDHTKLRRGPQIGSQSSYAYSVSFHALAEEIWGSAETHRCRLDSDVVKTQGKCTPLPFLSASRQRKTQQQHIWAGTISPRSITESNSHSRHRATLTSNAPTKRLRSMNKQAPKACQVVFQVPRPDGVWGHPRIAETPSA
jgi:hypothetical protein